MEGGPTRRSSFPPLGRVDFASNASKRREGSYLKKICESRRFLVTNLYRLDFHFHSVKPLHLGGGRPLSVRLRLPPSPTRRTRPFCRFATFSPFHRGHLPVSSGEPTPKGKARVLFCSDCLFSLLSSKVFA